MKKRWIVFTVLLIVALTAFLYIRFFFVFGEGVKSGELNYVVYKGLVFKTYEGKLIQSIRVEDAAGLYENGTVTGGMIPKLNCCIDAIEQGVEKVMIVDGRVENCVLLELLTDQGVGTEIVGEER